MIHVLRLWKVGAGLFSPPDGEYIVSPQVGDIIVSPEFAPVVFNAYFPHWRVSEWQPATEEILAVAALKRGSMATVLDTNPWSDMWGSLVPAGEYSLTSAPEGYVTIDAPYQLARRLITNAQFGEFVRAADFNSLRWWEGSLVPNATWLISHWRPAAGDAALPCGVNWYSAIAFCRWLGDKLGYEVGLPSVDEWDVAMVMGRAVPSGGERDWDNPDLGLSRVGWLTELCAEGGGERPGETWCATRRRETYRGTLFPVGSLVPPHLVLPGTGFRPARRQRHLQAAD